MNSPALRAVSVGPLIERARAYLNQEDCERLKTAYRFSDQAHLGQYRQSGEPYVSHPLAVAELCTEWRLDVQALMAALLHDTVEDTTATTEEIRERFGPEVAELVDGLSNWMPWNFVTAKRPRRKTSERCCSPWPVMSASS